ncbi:4-coumarate--CoA ligase family protein [Streptomyces sp. NPDC050617]|uniref:4-coumarate--CoA ligase family protein n=1 Tax=Streptomyces sp. NPDC050617 TaxID=3154628 RepID=UPI00341E0DE6
MEFRSEYADVALVDLPIHEAVLGRAAEFGDRPALIDGLDGRTISYAELVLAVDRLAASFADSGVCKGDVLALISPNTIAFPVVFYAATRAGATVTTVHPLCTADELAKQLGDCDARWIVTVSPLLGQVREAAEKVGCVREIVVCDRAEGCRSVQDMIGFAGPAPDVCIDPARDLAALPYSSGTTGVPKGVMLTHRSIATNLAQLDELVPSRPGQVVLAVLPFFHIYGLTALMNAPLRRGATVVVLPRFDVGQFLSAIEKYQVNGVYVAPPIVLALAKHPAATGYDLSSLEYVVSAAAPLDAGLAAACARRLGLPPIMQGYGMTELSPCATIWPLSTVHNAPPGSVGRLVAGTELRIVSLDGDGRDLGAGEEGEIVLRGPQVMKGYLGRPDETAAMIDPAGWLRTGDIGSVDEQGWLYVVDRVKELIKYKGYQVAPAELEAVLLAHEAIADAAVVGVRDADGEEIPKAYVVRQVADSGVGTLSEGDVMEYVAGRVAPYKKVRRVEFVDSVPRAASGKLLRRELRHREREMERVLGREMEGRSG